MIPVQKPAGVYHRLRSALASDRWRWLSPDVLNVAQWLRFRASGSAAWSAGASPNLAFAEYSDRLLVPCHAKTVLFHYSGEDSPYRACSGCVNFAQRLLLTGMADREGAISSYAAFISDVD